jgi:prepilin-type N-terminal cleavage/methylation domain-containing protein
MSKLLVTKNKQGFSFLEMSIVLTIIGILSVAAFAAAKSQSDVVKQRQTIAKMEVIEKAIAAYAAINDTLPCPGQTNYAMNNSLAGTANCSGTFAYYNNGHLPANASIYDLYIMGGTVPTITLSLPMEFMIDGWGNKFNYTVVKGLIGNGAYLEDNNMGSITVADITGAVRTDQAAYTLLSGGPNGYGVYSAYNTAANPAPTDANELINHNGMIGSSYIFVHSEPTATFDDILHYRTKWQIVQEAGYALSNQVCTTASTVMKAQDISANSTYYSYYCKSAPGDPNCAIYMTTLAAKVQELCLNK